METGQGNTDRTSRQTWQQRHQTNSTAFGIELQRNVMLVLVRKFNDACLRKYLLDMEEALLTEW